MTDIAIVVVAYNRPQALARLLKSLARASYNRDDHVPLVISIDGGGDSEVSAIAKQFEWPCGEKTVISHESNLGLKQHVLRAGDSTFEYGGIIMLEEDLIVSPQFYSFACGALARYQNVPMIAGISLYSYKRVYGLPFVPLVASGNTFLIKFPSSWGQGWTRAQWQQFRLWQSKTQENALKELDTKLPAAVAAWPTASSWKKEFARYLIDSGKYIVYPDVSFTTNMGDAGYHWRYKTLGHQVPLQFGPLNLQFVEPANAVSYDQFFELESRSVRCLGHQSDSLNEVEFDFYGRKPLALLQMPFTISSKRARFSERSYGLELLPQELNVIYNMPGSDFQLAPSHSFFESTTFPRLRLMKHQTSALGSRDLIQLLRQRLVAGIREKL